MTDFQFTFQQVEKFIPRMYVRPDVCSLFQGNKLRVIGVQLTIGDHVAEAFKKIGGIVHSRLRQAHALLLLVNPEERVRLRLKEVREIFAEDHGNTGKVPQRRNYAARLQLRQKAGRESS